MQKISKFKTLTDMQICCRPIFQCYLEQNQYRKSIENKKKASEAVKLKLFFDKSKEKFFCKSKKIQKTYQID